MSYGRIEVIIKKNVVFPQFFGDGLVSMVSRFNRSNENHYIQYLQNSKYKFRN